jgi:F0F1-type ATP synthase assembly protein I
MGSDDDRRQQMIFAAALASAVSQVGCVTVIVVVGALALGLFVDKTLDTRPLFTVLLLLVSIPVSVYLLVRIALTSAAQIKPPPSKPREHQPPDENESEQV